MSTYYVSDIKLNAKEYSRLVAIITQSIRPYKKRKPILVKFENGEEVLV